MRTTMSFSLFAWAAGAALFVFADDKKAPPATKAVESTNLPAKADPPAKKKKEPGREVLEKAKRAAAEAANQMRGEIDDVEAALDRKVQVDFNETPLSQALLFLGTESRVRIFTDAAGLANAMVDRDTPITLSMDAVRLGLLLELILEPLNLDYTIRENVLFVSSGERITQTRETSVIRIGEVLPPGPEAEGAGKRLVALITKNIDGDRWTANGGENSIEFLPEARSLVVTSNGRTKRKITKLLSEVRSATVAQGMPDRGAGTAPIAAR